MVRKILKVMNSNELIAMANLLHCIALGASWETVWQDLQTDDNPEGWGPSLGRDVEYCIATRIPMRLAPDALSDLAKIDKGRRANNLLESKGCTVMDMFCLASQLELQLATAMAEINRVTTLLNVAWQKKEGYRIALDHSACNADSSAVDVITAAQAVGVERYRPGSEWSDLNGKIGELCDALERYNGRPMAELGNATAPGKLPLDNDGPKAIGGEYFEGVQNMSARFVASLGCMIGYLAGRSGGHGPDYTKARTASQCVGYADALIAELKGKGEA